MKYDYLIPRWDQLTRCHTAFNSFLEFAHADYYPTLLPDHPEKVELADAYEQYWNDTRLCWRGEEFEAMRKDRITLADLMDESDSEEFELCEADETEKEVIQLVGKSAPGVLKAR